MESNELLAEDVASVLSLIVDTVCLEEEYGVKKSSNESSEVSSITNLCSRSRKCSKLKNHRGKCDRNRVYQPFWLQQRKIKLKEKQLIEKKVEELNDHFIILENKTKIAESTNEQLKEIEDELRRKTDRLSKKYEKLNLLLEQKNYSVTKRQKNPTDENMINDVKSSTRYRRRNETKNILEYIHGGKEAAVYGAWDYLTNAVGSSHLEELLLKFKRGKFIEKLHGKFNKAIEKSDTAIKKAVATKYLSHLSRRKYNFVCSIQKQAFSADSNGIVSPVKYGEYNLALKTAFISHGKVEKFIQNIDIGEIHIMSGYSGVARTVSTLCTMICDLHLKVPQLQSNLLWFNGIKNHFIFEFADDGAPESKEKTMTIGSLTLWNFGSRIRSREFHYSLHTASVDEKAQICSDLWKQHCEEMMLIESNTLTIDGEKVTVEFQPSADQSWQIWANNVLPASSTYPSPFANVHKGDLSKIGGKVGLDSTCIWKIPTENSRESEIKQLNDFLKTVPGNCSDKARHDKQLEFMASKGIRQLGEPRIGIYANRQRPDPLHLEINSWQHFLNLMYLESVRRDLFNKLENVLTLPKSSNGCGLKQIAKILREHYDTVSSRMKSITIRLIGSQAISLARYGYRLIDALEKENENEAEIITRMALSKLNQLLRDIGSQINRVNVTEIDYPDRIEKLCTQYFNIYALFFSNHCNITVWTMGYIIPYHTKSLFKDYEVGYGILTMQGKESKHSAIKQELKSNSNRSNNEDKTGKWYQLMRSSFIRNFYVPYHLPNLKPTYHSHYQSRVPNLDDEFDYCTCSRMLGANEDICNVCKKGMLVLECAEFGKLTDNVINIYKPITCTLCNSRFPDSVLLKSHMDKEHKLHNKNLNPENVVPARLNVNQLREELKKRNLSTTGNKEILKRRLEGHLSFN